jgi:hypothetical protein
LTHIRASPAFDLLKIQSAGCLEEREDRGHQCDHDEPEAKPRGRAKPVIVFWVVAKIRHAASPIKNEERQRQRRSVASGSAH